MQRTGCQSTPNARLDTVPTEEREVTMSRDVLVAVIFVAVGLHE